MKISCEKCGKKFLITEDKFKDKPFLAFKCFKCGHINNDVRNRHFTPPNEPELQNGQRQDPVPSADTNRGETTAVGEIICPHCFTKYKLSSKIKKYSVFQCIECKNEFRYDFSDKSDQPTHNQSAFGDSNSVSVPSTLTHDSASATSEPIKNAAEGLKPVTESELATAPHNGELSINNPDSNGSDFDIIDRLPSKPKTLDDTAPETSLDDLSVEEPDEDYNEEKLSQDVEELGGMIAGSKQKNAETVFGESEIRISAAKLSPSEPIREQTEPNSAQTDDLSRQIADELGADSKGKVNVTIPDDIISELASKPRQNGNPSETRQPPDRIPEAALSEQPVAAQQSTMHSESGDSTDVEKIYRDAICFDQIHDAVGVDLVSGSVPTDRKYRFFLKPEPVSQKFYFNKVKDTIEENPQVIGRNIPLEHFEIDEPSFAPKPKITKTDHHRKNATLLNEYSKALIQDKNMSTIKSYNKVRFYFITILILIFLTLLVYNYVLI